MIQMKVEELIKSNEESRDAIESWVEWVSLWLQVIDVWGQILKGMQKLKVEFPNWWWEEEEFDTLEMVRL